MSTEHTLSLLVENKPGALTRVTGLFARRGFNIDSLAVSITEDPMISRITIVVRGGDHTMEQITKQLHKLINVYKIYDLESSQAVQRELVMFKVNAPSEKRHEVVELANLFGANVVDVGRNTLVIALTAEGGEIQDFENLLREYGIKETARTGRIALPKGTKE